MTIPAYIPSKGRAATCSTARLLEASGIDVRIVVEPHEVADYRRAMPDAAFLVLPGDDGGLAVARNFVLDHARASGCGWFWMLDDDITGFFEVKSGRCVPRAAGTVLDAVVAVAGRSDHLAQAAPEYSQFAWSAGGRIAWDGYCDVCVAIHAARVGSIRYRPALVPKEDRDFTLQLRAAGWRTVRPTRYAFGCPKNGRNRGGLAPVYATPGAEERASRRMVEAWGPAICRFHRKRDGRPDVAIDWRALGRVS